MKTTLVAIRAKLVQDGMKSIDLLVHSYWIGRPSPCVVIEDKGPENVVGGSIESLEQIFQIKVAEHCEYFVKERENLFL